MSCFALCHSSEGVYFKLWICVCELLQCSAAGPGLQTSLINACCSGAAGQQLQHQHQTCVHQ